MAVYVLACPETQARGLTPPDAASGAGRLGYARHAVASRRRLGRVGIGSGGAELAEYVGTRGRRYGGQRITG